MTPLEPLMAPLVSVTAPVVLALLAPTSSVPPPLTPIAASDSATPKLVVPLLALIVRFVPPLAFRFRMPTPAPLVIAEPATCVCVPLMFSVPAPIFESVRAAALVIGPVRESELFVTSTDAFPIVIVEARLIVLAVLRVEFEDSVRVPGEAPEAIVLLPPEMNSVDAFVVRLLSLFVPPVRLKV